MTRPLTVTGGKRVSMILPSKPTVHPPVAHLERTKSGRINLSTFHRMESINISEKTHRASIPTHVKRQHPHQQQHHGISPQPRNRRGNPISKHKDRERSQQLSQVTPRNHYLRVFRAPKQPLCSDRYHSVLQVSVAVEGERVADRKPDELSPRHDHPSALVD